MDRVAVACQDWGALDGDLSNFTFLMEDLKERTEKLLKGEK